MRQLAIPPEKAERYLAAMKAEAAQTVQAEDCLTLTVRSPAEVFAAARREGGGAPVMLWIHGGDHQSGAGTERGYATNTFPKMGVVQVNINYRLGLFGYFAHPELSSANMGTMDQIAALD